MATHTVTPRFFSGNINRSTYGYADVNGSGCGDEEASGLGAGWVGDRWAYSTGDGFGIDGEWMVMDGSGAGDIRRFSRYMTYRPYIRP